MKNCKRFNRFLSLVLALVMVFSVLPMPRALAAEETTTLYLKPNDNWLQASARFAVYYWTGSGDAWIDMADADGDGYYEADVPTACTGLIFCRMNPGTTANNWDNKWNQSADLAIPSNGNNCYTVEAGSWDKGNGTWSAYTPDGGETEEPTEPVPGDTYVVAGVAELCGEAWAATSASNTMSYNGDGTYSKVYPSVPVGQSYQLKVVKNGSTWYGDGENNITFNVTAVCDVTVTFDTADNSITVTGDGVNFDQPTSFDSIHAVGDGRGNWLNGANWDTSANKMTQTSTGVYEITFKNVPAGSYQFKFAANGTWADSWGAGTGNEAIYNSQTNYSLTLTATSDVTLKLDLTGYDYTTKKGATYEVTVAESGDEEEPTVDFYLYGFVNGADIAGNEEAYRFVDGKLTAAFTAADNYVFVKDSNGTSYMTAEYCTDTTATLSATGSEKLYVPGNVELEFTLVENEDGTLTLSYADVSGKTTVTVHFLKPDTWGAGINAYVWTAAGALEGYSEYNAWPGKAISENASHPGWYDLVVKQETPAAFNFIFNDGGNQTADLATGDITGSTELWVVGNDVLTEAPGEWSGDYDYTVYFHFLKPDSWKDTIHAYVWDAAGTSILGAWPGTAADVDTVNTGWYNASVIMEENDALNVIFNDNGSNQTADLTTGTLNVTTHIWIVNGTVQTTAPDGWVDPNMTVHVPGTFPGPSWDAASNQMTYDSALGLYVYTFEAVPAANYEYKIALNGSWNENYGAGGVKDGSNIAVTVPETMDVIVYYHPQTHNSVTSVTYKFVEVSVSGTGIETTALTDSGLTGIYSGTVAMAAGTYTDVVITCDGEEYKFAEIVVEEDKDVTFYIDPVTGIFYCDASDTPIETHRIVYNSQDWRYKEPFGAVEEDEEVTFSIETGMDVTSAVLVIKGLDSYPMTIAENAGYMKTWSVTTSISHMGEYDYYFVLSNGSTVAVYGDDDGYYGEGTVTDLTSVMPYDLVVYEKGFETPDWMKNAVIYQIFPDRFFDGDESNNKAQTWARGAVDYEYITDWYTLPENPEQEAMLSKEQYLSHGAHYGDGEWSNEIYGGDLDGITERIDYLKALGVNVIYLNPVFWSISNHRYDAVDYTEIDPILGTLGDFEELVAVAEANGMHIILDGVFNHVSDDSVYFDRYYKFLPDAAEKYDGKIGAYPYWAYVYDTMAAEGITQAEAEAKAKTHFTAEYGITDYCYTEWFAVSSTTMAGSADTIGLRAGKEVYSYEGWWGYDSMPVIYSTNGSEYQTGNWAEEIISGQNSVNAYWIGKGMDGWRLDVANEVSDETWQNFRDSVKALNSDAVIIGEIWDDATKYLMGDMYDSVMNYQFRNAVTSFAMGTGSEATAKALEKIRERYPEEAFYAMMNLVGSHDTTRLLSYLDGIGDDRNDKSEAAAFPTYETTSQLAKNRQHLVSFLQFTYAGAPTIYYGDEIGMVGSDDPDDRRAFEWGKGNQALVEWYAKLAAIREAYPELRTGAVVHEQTNNDSLLIFKRMDSDSSLLVVANNSTSTQKYTLAYDCVDLVTGNSYPGGYDFFVPAMSGMILANADDAKEITVNTAALAPAYDPAYIIPERSAEPAEEAEVIRVKGKTRYETGFAIANYLKEVKGIEKFEAMIVAYGQKFPDALTGSYLAAVKNAPILLTEESADAKVLAYIEENLTSGGKVYILGGTAAVSQEFEDGAKAKGFDVQRVKGKDRYATNLEILAEAGITADQKILIATGNNYADSLSASATGLPMVLVGDSLTDAQKEFLATTSKDFVILGGTGAVSEEIEAELAAIGTVERVKGKTRYETSVEIAKYFFTAPECAVLGYANDFPDGLCAGPLAMALKAPLILTADANFAAADAYVENLTSGVVTGGTARISDDTVREIFELEADAEIVEYAAKPGVVEWKFDAATGTLTIFGKGAMDDYEGQLYLPWKDHINDIKSFVVEPGVTTVGNAACVGLMGLTEVSLPEGLTKVGTCAFAMCTKLKQVKLPETVTEIGYQAFETTGLTSIVIPASVKTMGHMIFSFCDSLTEITFEGDAPELTGGGVFPGVTATVYYPAGNATWTEEVMEAFGGEVTWVPYSA